MYANSETRKRTSLRIMRNTVNYNIFPHFAESGLLKKESSFFLDSECPSIVPLRAIFESYKNNYLQNDTTFYIFLQYILCILQHPVDFC